MNRLLEHLVAQHRDAEAMLARLEAAGERLRKEGPQGDVLLELSACREALEGEVDSHFREEEQALFPVLGRHIGFDEGPIATMMEEHARLREIGLRYEGSLAALEAGEPGPWGDRLREAAGELGTVLPPHIAKEDEVLFPMAESILSEREWEECANLWKLALEAPR